MLEPPTQGSSPFFLPRKLPKGSSPRAPSPGFDAPLLLFLCHSNLNPTELSRDVMMAFSLRRLAAVAAGVGARVGDISCCCSSLVPRAQKQEKRKNRLWNSCRDTEVLCYRRPSVRLRCALWVAATTGRRQRRPRDYWDGSWKYRKCKIRISVTKFKEQQNGRGRGERRRGAGVGAAGSKNSGRSVAVDIEVSVRRAVLVVTFMNLDPSWYDINCLDRSYDKTLCSSFVSIKSSFRIRQV
jgi:hypothetical protein